VVGAARVHRMNIQLTIVQKELDGPGMPMMRRSPNSSGNLAVNRVWRARRWEAIQQGQELSFAKTEWCLPATSRKWSAMRSVGKVETHSRPLPPKHQVKPWPCSDQKARKTTSMTWFTKSAKPPSPVQIRAAPPKSSRKVHSLFLRRTTCGRKWSRIARASTAPARQVADSGTVLRLRL
jgi:hypothetical protein